MVQHVRRPSAAIIIRLPGTGPIVHPRRLVDRNKFVLQGCRKRQPSNNNGALGAENRRRETKIVDQLSNDGGEANSKQSRLVPHGEPVHEIEAVVEAEPVRPELRPQGHVQKEHGHSGAEILRNGDRDNRAGDLVRRHDQHLNKRNKRHAEESNGHAHDASWRGVQVHAGVHPRRGATMQRQRQRLGLGDIHRQFQRPKQHLLGRLVGFHPVREGPGQGQFPLLSHGSVLGQMGAEAPHEGMAERVQRGGEQSSQPFLLGELQRQVRQGDDTTDHRPREDWIGGASREGRELGGDPRARESRQVHQVQRSAVRVGASADSTISGPRSFVGDEEGFISSSFASPPRGANAAVFFVHIASRCTV